MELTHFDSMITRVFKYFNRKVPDSQQLNLWFNKVKFIPKTAIPYIYEFITDKADSLPSNIPQKLKTGWGCYLRDNPRMIARVHEKTPCNDCSGKGIIRYRQLDELYGKPAETTCICGGCHNWKRHFDDKEGFAVFTRRQLENQGCAIWPYSDYPAVTSKKALVDSVGMEMPF